MHLAVDCRCVHPHMGGIGRAALDLVRALGAHPRGHRITMIVASDRVGELMVSGVHILPVDGAMIDERYDQLLLPSALQELGADAYLNTTFSVPAIKTTKLQVPIIHDVVFEDRPDYVDPPLRRFLSRWSRFAAQEADHLVTVSDHARERIRKVYGVESSRITRIYNGLSPSSFEPPTKADAERVRSKFDLHDPYLLYLGSIEPKKGMVELLTAYRRASDQGLAETLVLAGGKGGPEFNLDALVREAGGPRRVRVLGFVSEEEKKALVAGSSLFVYPSLYEGFGIPPLEAMALGVPTLVSDETSLPEIVGKAAIATPVRDAGVFAQALVRGTRDDVFRRRALTAGPERARQFRWEQSADQVLDLFERLGGN